MTTSRSSKFILCDCIIAIVALGTASFVTASDLEVRLQPSRSQTGKADYDNLQVVFVEKDAPEQRLIVTDAVTTASSYELSGKKGDQITPLEIASVKAVPKGGPALRLEITPKEKLDPGKFDSLQLRPKDASLWRFTDGSSYHYAGKGSFAVIETKVLKENRNYYQRFSGLQNHVDTGHNLKGGVLSLNLHYEARSSEESTKPGAFVFFANGKGDFVFPTKNKGSFFNSLNADVEYAYSHLPNVWEDSNQESMPLNPLDITPPKNRWEPYWDLGASGKYESDQNFANVNLLAGVVAHIIARNPITDALQRGILLQEPLFLNPERRVDATIAPLFTFRYDFVDHVKESKSVDTGQNRFTADLFYRLPLARGINVLKNIGVTKQVFDSDFIAELEGVYDVDKQKLTDNSKLTLEFRPRTDIEHQPSFTLTYAQGRASPTFKHFDAFLAGLKMPF